MNKKLIASVLLASVVLTSCGKAPEVTETEETTIEQTTSATTETISSDTTTTAATTADQSDIDEKFRGLVPGDTFTFGEYEGEEMNWIVLSTTGYICYCIAEDNILVRNYDSSGRVDDLNDSDLFHWLNEDFYEGSFTDEEKVRIKYAVSESDISSDYKIYLLSRRDVMSYGTILQAHPTSDDWWLRSGSNSAPESVDICSCSGQISYDGASCSDWNGVRPAMKLYIGVDEDRLDLNNLTPTPTPTPTEATEETAETTVRPHDGNDPVPYEPEMMDIPTPMTVDPSLSEEANLDAFYNNCLVPMAGQAPLDPVTTQAASFNGPWLDLHGAVSRVIGDLDGDGDLEMVAFVFVAEEVPYEYLYDGSVINNQYAYEQWEVKYRLHLVLCDDVDGQVQMIKDLPLQTWYNDPDYPSAFVGMDEDHATLSNSTYWSADMAIYTISRDGKTYILITNDLYAYTFSDGYCTAGFLLEVTADDILYSSAYCQEIGSACTEAQEVRFENGVEVSRDVYYDEPDPDHADMQAGIEYYYDRLGLEHAYRDPGDGSMITDPSASLVADISILPGERDPEDSSVVFTYSVQIP